MINTEQATKLEEVKEAIQKLWEPHASEILASRKQRREEANELRMLWREAKDAEERSVQLRASAEPLVLDHSKALLADDDEMAEEIKQRHRDLLNESREADETTETAYASLREAGVQGERPRRRWNDP